MGIVNTDFRQTQTQTLVVKAKEFLYTSRLPILVKSMAVYLISRYLILRLSLLMAFMDMVI